MADKDRSWLANLAHLSTIVTALVTLGIVGALAIGLEAFLGVVWELSPIERALLGLCAFVIALGLALGTLNRYVLDRRRLSSKESQQLRQENRQLRAENKQLQSQNEWLRTEIPEPNDEELIVPCRQLSEELLPFLEDRAKEDPQTGMLSGERMRYQSETIAQYNARFATRVGPLLGPLELRGWITAAERQQFENPIMPMTIQQIANRFAVIGGKSRDQN